jgi:hypothetical protein
MNFIRIFAGIVVILLCVEVLHAMPTQRCKACKRRHPLPQGQGCLFIDPPEEEPQVSTHPVCRTCHRGHSPPRGRRCERVLLDEDLHDPFMDNPFEPGRHDSPDSLPRNNTTQVLLDRLLNQVGEMNNNVLSMNQRVASLESAAQARAPVVAPRDTPADDGGLRARMRALGINNNDTSDPDDEWEVAGAGARPQGKKQLKSGALIAAQHDVVCQFDYPHKHVMRGAGRPAPLALDLTWSEFVYGYTEQMDDPALDPTVRHHMASFLKLLMEDVNVRPWPSVRHFHMTIIQAMEAGQLEWGDSEHILSIQRQHVRAVVPNVPAPRRVNMARPPTGRTPTGPTPLYCAGFQSGSCDKPAEHDSPRGIVHHVCAFCLRVTGNSYPSHGEADCRRKKLAEGATKNSQ